MLNIVIWGTGKCSDNFLNKIDNSKFVILGFVESKKIKSEYKNKPVYEAKDLLKLNYDYLIVASNFSREIRELCIKLDIKLNNVIWIHVQRDHVKENLYNISGIERIVPNFGKDYCDRYSYDEVLIPYSINEKEDEEYATDYIYDYVRLKTFDLITQELDDSFEGDVAELGVFQGDFAKHINRRFPNRKLYLFDTFEGFDNQEAKKELEAGRIDEAFIEFFKLGSEELTLSKMKYKENCIIKKGLFPSSLNGLESKFLFVSIDVDLEQSIYEGLIYFYPRMVKGGYIFIHDYSYFEGVKRAVYQYEKEYGKVSKVPITDLGGTLIIIK